MKEWTTEQRYQRLEDTTTSSMADLTALVSACPWRFSYHIQPPTGLLNDPNGLCQQNGLYHLFFQWFPLGPTHGLKYWYHVTSQDLVNWNIDENIVRPDTPYDSHGAYSGSALVEDDIVSLFYTGNVRDEYWQRHAYQMLATFGPDGVIQKQESPIIPHPPLGYTSHFRDPKVWIENGTYYMVIGAQRTNETGAILIYSSDNKIRWQFLGVLHPSQEIDGYMWECPDLFHLDGKDILLFCPQGLTELQKENENVYPSVYLIGDFSLKTQVFSQDNPVEKLDYGFDFYAPQSFLNEAGQRILFGWFGSPEITLPTDINGWQHAMTLPRLLSVKNGRLYQEPFPTLSILRGECENYHIKGSTVLKHKATATYEMIVDIENITEDITISLYKNDAEAFYLTYHHQTTNITINRENFTNSFATEYGTERSVKLDSPLQKLHIFRDTSSLEIFINDGAYVMSSRFFPVAIEGDIDFSSQTDETTCTVSWYPLATISLNQVKK